PGKTPHQNVRFLVFLAAVLKGVHKHAGLLRAGIGTSGNEHRLGANEAPPAIISVFMGQMLTRVIEDIAEGKTSPTNAQQAMIKLGVARLPEVEKDNTDRNRTSPFAFTGAKFEFRAVGSSQSIAFPVMLLNACVAEAIGELTATLRETMKKTKSVDDAVLKIVRDAFKDSTPVRFEGNNYSGEWVVEAAKRKLLNLRRTPEALAQLLTKDSRTVLTKLGILSKPEIESRYHIRLERYVKDMLIEIHTLEEMIDTMVLPAAFSYLATLTRSAADAKTAGLKTIPQLEAANTISSMIEELQTRRAALGKVTAKAEGMHEALEAQSKLLTADGAERMADVRESSDALELMVSDDLWPLPKYREMLFPL
ncbi:MAG TPA: glutamine synthetase type III, partial [Gemmatimonadaceae bacterium]|nr:glutamine synthetase type III [Gemmatimonadaceae bacterium]